MGSEVLYSCGVGETNILCVISFIYCDVRILCSYCSMCCLAVITEPGQYYTVAARNVQIMPLICRTFLIKTDHNPLVPLLSTKNLDHLPPGTYSYFDFDCGWLGSSTHVPSGKLLYTADTLSQAPAAKAGTMSCLFGEEVKAAAAAQRGRTVVQLVRHR